MIPEGPSLNTLENPRVSKFIQNGSSFSISGNDANQVHEKLPPGIYTIVFPQMGAPFLQRGEDFDLPTKLYGNTGELADRILTTFRSRTGNTGAMLHGDKGAGKTLLTKVVAMRAAALGIPTILVSDPLVGEGFAKFLASIDCECVVLFDEFEKTYDDDKQEGLLSLLDGVFNSRKLFLLTANNVYRIDENIRNRPGRAFYSIAFGGLSERFIREYCQDKLDDKSKIDEMATLATLYRSFSFDMLQALVEELNRYGESIEQALKLLNAKPMEDSGSYDLQALVNGSPVPCTPRTLSHNPLAQPRIGVILGGPEEEDGDYVVGTSNSRIRDSGQRTFLKFERSHVKSVDSSGKIVYDDGKGHQLVCTRSVPNVYEYSAY